MKEIKDKLKEWGSICRISNIIGDPLTYSHSDMLSFAKYYHETKLKNNEVLDLVSESSICVSDDFIKGWDARVKQLKYNGWLEEDFEVYGDGYSGDELIKYSR